jgi:pimeloyl-ACP methyl ester carboxylesterase
MRPTEIEAVGELAGDALAAGGTFIKEMHEGIASRPFGILGPAAAPVRVIHGGVSRAVFAGLRGGLRGAAVGGARLAARRAREDGPAVGASTAGSLALAALNGLYGDQLTDRGSALATRMEIPDLEAGRAAATPRVALFAHGLFETDAWWRGAYGRRLRDDLGFTPLHLRYNTGLRISRNGRDLARLLDEIVAGWPVDVEELVLVGHSMGGLVVRSACHYAQMDERAWTSAVKHVFCLGSPHLGADLEKGLNALGSAFGRLPETRAFRSLINARSVGIKDLRYGSCVDEDWCDCDPDEFLRDRCTEVPFLPDANYYFVGACVTEGPVGTYLGDLLVRLPSASGRGNGRGRRIPFEVDNGLELNGLTHFDLLDHPAVYEQIRTWITRPPAAAPSP